MSRARRREGGQAQVVAAQRDAALSAAGIAGRSHEVLAEADDRFGTPLEAWLVVDVRPPTGPTRRAQLHDCVAALATLAGALG